MTKKIGSHHPKPGNGVLLNEPELAKALGESGRTIRSWRYARIIPTICLGYRSYRYKLTDVLAALEARTIPASKIK